MKFLDLTAQYRAIKKEIDWAIKEVLDAGIFIGGKKVEDLELGIAKLCKSKYAVGVNSGTDALFLCLKASGIGRGDEVITTPFTFIATAEAIANSGARPVFVDIAPKSFNINPAGIEAAITRKTKAIMPVHLFGQTSDMDEIMKIARRYKLRVVEDAAQALGAEYKNQMAGAIGDSGCFSFFPSKSLGAYGDGGMVATDSKELADKIRLLRNHGSSPREKYLNLISGTNSRLDALQAAILGVKLRYLKKWNKIRMKKALYYSELLEGIGEITTPSILSNRTHIFHQYTIRTKSRDKLHDCLKTQGVPTMIYYPLPLHLQPVFKYLGYKAGDFPEAEKAAKDVLSLPIYPELKRKEQDFIIEKIKEFF